MPDDSTAVDVQSLEVFHAALATRLSEVDSAIATMNRDLTHPPQLGTFFDASNSTAAFESLRRDYAERLGRLRAAVVAAQSATQTIIDNYKTTEQRNHASAADIAAKLDGIRTALQEGATGG
jgi:hypothetical protein